MAFLTRNIWPNDGRNRSHIPNTPVWLAGIRITQLILAIATLALTAYGTATIQKAVGYGRITNWSGSEGYPFSWFSCAWTLTYLIWLGVAYLYIPIMYNCWVHLGLELLTLVFWLITMALLASHSDDLDSIDAYVTSLGPAFKKYYQEFIQTYARGFVDATFAGTGVATVNFVLFVVSIIFFGRALHAMRKANMEQAMRSDVDKILVSPQMTNAMPGYLPWNGQYPPQAYAYYGQPYSPHVSMPPSAHPSIQNPPHGFQQAFFPISHFPPQQGPGGAWPQQNYGMYQQQVPIAAQSTGQGQDLGTPQFPMVSPVVATKTDAMNGVRTPPPPAATVAEGSTTGMAPVELNGARVEEDMPAELANSR